MWAFTSVKDMVAARAFTAASTPPGLGMTVAAATAAQNDGGFVGQEGGLVELSFVVCLDLEQPTRLWRCFSHQQMADGQRQHEDGSNLDSSSGSHGRF
uniref:Uncharacterized protein n=1 Tax=Oryza punctata TaxID=4537 RepID=A0A0E0M0Y7_ORYPU